LFLPAIQALYGDGGFDRCETTSRKRYGRADYAASSERSCDRRAYVVPTSKQERTSGRVALPDLVVGVAQRVAATVTARFVAVIGPPVVCVPRAAGAARWPDAAGAVFQAAATAIWRLWSFSRLWVAVISRHSESAAEPPRR
jgi:hypothetical protein